MAGRPPAYEPLGGAEPMGRAARLGSYPDPPEPPPPPPPKPVYLEPEDEP